jgi:hypothetical protein
MRYAVDMSIVVQLRIKPSGVKDESSASLMRGKLNKAITFAAVYRSVSLPVKLSSDQPAIA